MARMARLLVVKLAEMATPSTDGPLLVSRLPTLSSVPGIGLEFIRVKMSQEYTNAESSGSYLYSA